MNFLLVDDSSTLRKILANAIQQILSCDIDECSNGAEAIELIQSSKLYDAIFLDINMPVMDGFECIESLKKLGIFENQKIILISSQIAEYSDDFFQKLGVYATLAKPFDKESLALQLQSIFAFFNRGTIKKEFENYTLIIDNSTTYRTLLASRLFEYGMNNFVYAQDGRLGLNHINDYAQALDLVLLDLHIGTLEADLILKQLQISGLISQLKIVLTSPNIELLQQMQSKYPAIEILPKPLCHTQFYEVLTHLFDVDAVKANDQIEDMLIETHESITTTSKVIDCIKNHFQTNLTMMQKYYYLTQTDKKIDFFLFQKPLEATLQEIQKIDANCINEAILKHQKLIANLLHSYSNLSLLDNETKRRLFLEIFLRYQKEYTKLLKLNEKYKETIELGNQKLKKAVEMIEKSMDESLREKCLVQKEVIEQKLEKLDTTLKENMVMIDLYEREHYNEFETSYNKERTKLKDMLNEVLDAVCYRYNKVIWSEVNKSVKIKSFCMKQKIDGALDEKKFFAYLLEQKEIMEDKTLYEEIFNALQIYKKRGRKNIAIVFDDLQTIEKMKQIVQNSTNDYNVRGFLNYAAFMQSIVQSSYDIVIVNYKEEKNSQLQQLKQNNKSCELLFVLQKQSKETMIELFQYKLLHPTIKNYLFAPIHLNQTALLQKIEELV